jgi:hypothetical protein
MTIITYADFAESWVYHKQARKLARKELRRLRIRPLMRLQSRKRQKH